MRILILGATGFIGGQIARLACESGWEVHGLRRRAGATGAIGDLPVTWHEGDLNQSEAVVTAMRDCDVVYHAAAYYAWIQRDIPTAMRQAASQMRSVLAAARDARVRRVVYTSSLSTIGPPPPGENRLADERDHYLSGSALNAYFESKYVMEQEAIRAAGERSPVIILIPTAVFGPGDVKPTTGQLLLEQARGRLPVSIDLVTNFVDVREVAQAHIRAASAGEIGQRYIIGGHNLNVRDALAEAARAAGVRPPRWVVRRETAIRLLEATRWLPLPIPEMARGLAFWQPLNDDLGKRTFGYSPRPWAQTAGDATAWFKDHNYL